MYFTFIHKIRIAQQEEKKKRFLVNERNERRHNCYSDTDGFISMRCTRAEKRHFFKMRYIKFTFLLWSVLSCITLFFKIFEENIHSRDSRMGKGNSSQNDFQRILFVYEYLSFSGGSIKMEFEWFLFREILEMNRFCLFSFSRRISDG